jgi:hypothetical protein
MLTIWQNEEPSQLIALVETEEVYNATVSRKNRQNS